LKILYLESVDSTQLYIKELLKKKLISTPFAVVSENQTDGKGSRDNSWTGLKGNLFCSFSIAIKELPIDLKLESASIYFSHILKATLEYYGSKVWLKWPNDFYINNLKIGGLITNIVGENLIVGIGLNLLQAPNGFSYLDILITKEKLLKEYFLNIEKKRLWKQVFSKYKLEFYKNKDFFTHKNNLKISLENVELQNDGSIISNGERIYSRR